MKFIKQYRIVISIVLIVALLIIIRTFNHNSFRYDAVKWADPSLSGSNIISAKQAENLTGEKLLINLGNSTAVNSRFKEITRDMDPLSILEKENIRIIRRNRGPVILTSEDISVSSRIWMILSEMGVKNLFILLPENRSIQPS